jgi:hypothetical protein
MSHKTYGATVTVPANSDAKETVVEVDEGPAVEVYLISLFTTETHAGAVEASVFAGEDRVAPSDDSISPTASVISLETDHRLSPSGTLEVRATNTSGTDRTLTVVAHAECLYDEESYAG